jgi:integrase
VAKERKGTITQRDGKLYARIQFTDESGKRRDIWRKAENRTRARHIIRQLLKEVENSTPASLDAVNMRFDELADYFQTHHLKPAEYIGDRKISGVRSLTPAIAALTALRKQFGRQKLRSITYGEVSAYRTLRLKTPTRHGGQRAIATVNRELDKLRRMFNIAIQQGWLAKNPFQSGNSLISHADERHRERVLSREEEHRLLNAIEAEPKREHLKGILLVALDCALRRGEILTLTWLDIDLQHRTIQVRAFNSKTARARTVAMTTRVYEDLRTRIGIEPHELGECIFKIKDVKRSFNSACRQAGITDFRLHDCRHTAITRMIRAGLPPVEVMRISGHSTMAAFYRYVNLDSDAVFRAAAALDALQAKWIYHDDSATSSIN